MLPYVHFNNMIVIGMHKIIYETLYLNSVV